MNSSKSDARPIPLLRHTGKGAESLNSSLVVELFIFEQSPDFGIENFRIISCPYHRSPKVPPISFARKLKKRFRSAAIPSADNCLKFRPNVREDIPAPTPQ